MGNMLGSRIRFLREERHLSQLEMAKELNISNVQLSRYESGARKPDPETIVRIADFLGVSADYLLGRTTSVREVPPDYASRDDIRLILQCKKTPALYALIQDLSRHPEKTDLMIKIWEAVKEAH
ncbi:XRE family transcriptional regulator [Sporolactobacillus sp. THM7-7]|nr:XRE family transcriptional regulator [Sporolactobacillus sp. THM7-7]